jgi:hypothetical protein
LVPFAKTFFLPAAAAAAVGCAQAVRLGPGEQIGGVLDDVELDLLVPFGVLAALLDDRSSITLGADDERTIRVLLGDFDVGEVPL